MTCVPAQALVAAGACQSLAAGILSQRHTDAFTSGEAYACGLNDPGVARVFEALRWSGSAPACSKAPSHMLGSAGPSYLFCMAHASQASKLSQGGGRSAPCSPSSRAL